MPRIEEPDPPITAAECDTFVGRAGMQPPEDYRAFMLVQNGGMPLENVFVRRDGEASASSPSTSSTASSTAI